MECNNSGPIDFWVSLNQPMNECLSRKLTKNSQFAYKTLVCEISEFYNLKLLGALVFDTSLMTSRAKKLQSKLFHCVLIGVFHNVMMMPLQMNFIQRVRHYRPDIFDALQMTPGDYSSFLQAYDLSTVNKRLHA